MLHCCASLRIMVKVGLVPELLSRILAAWRSPSWKALHGRNRSRMFKIRVAATESQSWTISCPGMHFLLRSNTRFMAFLLTTFYRRESES